MRTSKFLISTLKEVPAEASVASHQLMLRAGLIRQLASGLYVWLPAGLRVLNKAENIIREEMDKSGALAGIRQMGKIRPRALPLPGQKGKQLCAWPHPRGSGNLAGLL